MRCHLGFFFELSAAQSSLCPLSMKHTLASGEQEPSFISASEIKRRISFFRSESDLSAFSSFIFPCLRESGTTVLSDMTASGGGGTRERAGENCRRAGERLSCSAAFGQGRGCPALPSSGRGRAVSLSRRQTGNGLSLAPAARNVRAAVCFLWAVTSARQAPPAAASGVPSPALLPVGFAGGLPSAGLSGGGETILFQNYHNKSTRICQ